MAGCQIPSDIWDANEVGSWYTLYSARSMVWHVAGMNVAWQNGNFTVKRLILTIALLSVMCGRGGICHSGMSLPMAAS